MEKLLNSYDKEYMKMAMLKHEETFREQVYELHRLYGIQKLLMNKTKSNGKQVQEQSRLLNSKSSDLVNNPHPHHSIHKRVRPPAEEEYVDDETELELTLGPTSQCRRKKILDTSNSTATASASLSSSSSTVSGSDQRISIPRENLSAARNWSLRMPNSKPEVEEEFRRDNRHSNNSNPSWLFQSLTLNTSSKNHLQSV